jgi:hypothetical protein
MDFSAESFLSVDPLVAVQVFKTIKKRDGRTVGFDAEKIPSAITRAGEVTREFDQSEASKLTVRVLDQARTWHLGPSQRDPNGPPFLCRCGVQTAKLIPFFLISFETGEFGLALCEVFARDDLGMGIGVQPGNHPNT